MIENPQISPEELMKHVTAPDFPTGGIIFGYQGVQDAYLTGRGKIIVRGRANIETMKNGRENIIISELPVSGQQGQSDRENCRACQGWKN
jgi:DNA gyrase subunit A